MINLLQKLFFGLILIVLAAPLVVVTGVSFNSKKSLLFPPEGFSLKWYGELFLQKDWLNALTNSLVIATSASTLAISIALPLALYVSRRYGTLSSKLLYGLGVAPFMLPPVITALGFLVFWITIGLYGNIMATIVSHAIFLVTLPLVTISMGLNSVNKEFLEAATVMGARKQTVFMTVTLPLIRPYIISGFAFAFVLSLNEYIIAYLVAGFTVETLPIKIFNSIRYGYTPVMASVAVFFVIIAIVVFSLVACFCDLPKLLGAERKK